MCNNLWLEKVPFMIIGNACVSTPEQNAELQVDALEKAGAEQIFQEKFTGKLRERPELSQCLHKTRSDYSDRLRSTASIH